MYVAPLFSQPSTLSDNAPLRLGITISIFFIVFSNQSQCFRNIQVFLSILPNQKIILSYLFINILYFWEEFVEGFELANEDSITL